MPRARKDPDAVSDDEATAVADTEAPVDAGADAPAPAAPEPPQDQGAGPGAPATTHVTVEQPMELGTQIAVALKALKDDEAHQKAHDELAHPHPEPDKPKTLWDRLRWGA